jgi:hypothetical protein
MGWVPPVELEAPVLDAPLPSVLLPDVPALQATKAKHSKHTPLPKTDDHALAFISTKVAEPSDLARRRARLGDHFWT